MNEDLTDNIRLDGIARAALNGEPVSKADSLYLYETYWTRWIAAQRAAGVPEDEILTGLSGALEDGGDFVFDETPDGQVTVAWEAA